LQFGCQQDDVTLPPIEVTTLRFATRMYYEAAVGQPHRKPAATHHDTVLAARDQSDVVACFTQHAADAATDGARTEHDDAFHREGLPGGGVIHR
jgi:hypothetical protein